MGGVLACERCGGEIRRGHTEEGPGNFYCTSCGLVYGVDVDKESGTERPGDLIGSMTGGAFTGDKCPTCGRPWNDEGGHNPAAGEVPILPAAPSAAADDDFIEGPPPEEGREVLVKDTSANKVGGEDAAGDAEGSEAPKAKHPGRGRGGTRAAS